MKISHKSISADRFQRQSLRRALVLALTSSAYVACFQITDNGAASQTMAAPSSGGADADFQVILETPPIQLDPNDASKTTSDPCVAVANQALQIRKNHCAMCHEGPGAAGEPLTFILEDNRLTSSLSLSGKPYIVPGDAAHSLIYQRVAVFLDMPPASSDVANPANSSLSTSDCSILEQWISCLAGNKSTDAGSSISGGASFGGTSGAVGTSEVTGGASSKGDTSFATGGSTIFGIGGALNTGGLTATGGTRGLGGSLSTGGQRALGGSFPTGGVRASGGVNNSGGGIAATGGLRGTGGLAGTGGAAGADGARYNFETSTQGWVGMTTPGYGLFTSVSTSTAQHFAGSRSLAGSIAAGSALIYDVGVVPPAIAVGTTITFHVLLPQGALIDWIQPYVQYSNGFTGNYVGAPTTGSWITVTVVVPTQAVTITQIGVQFNTAGAWNGTVYVDSVNF